MIDHGHPRLSIVRQCELASISRSSFYREPTPESEGKRCDRCVLSTSSSWKGRGTARGRWRGICGAMVGASDAIVSAG